MHDILIILMLELYLILFVIGVFDCADPVNVGLHIYLLGTKKPISASFAYMLGIFVTYFLIGILLLVGLGPLIQNIYTQLSPTTEYSIGLALGLLCLYFAYRLYIHREEPPKHRTPKSLAFWDVFTIGAVLAFLNFPTMLPYLAAINFILKAQMGIIGDLAALIFYNIIYILPMIIVLCIYSLSGKWGMKILQKLNRYIDQWSLKVMALFLFVLGLYLALDGMIYFIS